MKLQNSRLSANWKYRPLVYSLALFTTYVSSFSMLTANIRIMDEAAIAYTAFLSKAEFDQRFPGKMVSDLTELENGWYVIYEHQGLNYYFGPILLQSTGRDYLAQLKQIVVAALEQRPSIQEYRLTLRFEPSSQFDSGAGDEDVVISNEDADDSNSFWTKVREFFGF